MECIDKLPRLLSDKPKWEKRQCAACPNTYWVLAEWERPPRCCEFCRVRKIRKKMKKLLAYFKLARSKRISRRTEEDTQELNNICEIEQKLSLLHQTHGGDEGAMWEELIHIPLVRKILIRMDKETPRATVEGNGYHVDFGLDKGCKFGGFVQGGSPGLGKR
jgi:hypothetical protein